MNGVKANSITRVAALHQIVWKFQQRAALQVKDIDIEKDDPAANLEAMKEEIIDKTSRQISEASETLQKEIEKIVSLLNPISEKILDENTGITARAW